MARRSPIDILLASRMAALTSAIPAALGGEPEAVHQTRVASRRLREVIPILADAGPAAERARDAVRKVTRALGPLRELDVTTALYAEAAAASAVPPLAHAAVERALTRDRGAAVRAMRRTLSPTHGVRIERALLALSAEAEALPVGAVADAVEARLRGRARRVATAIEALGVLYAPERLHDVRIAVKQLRYALEIAGELRRARIATSLRQLRSVQDLLGRAHDLHVLGEHLRQVEAQLVTRSRPAARDLRRLARRIDDECRQLHAAFLSRSAALHTLATALGAHSSPVRRRTAA